METSHVANRAFGWRVALNDVGHSLEDKWAPPPENEEAESRRAGAGSSEGFSVRRMFADAARPAVLMVGAAEVIASHGAALGERFVVWLSGSCLVWPIALAALYAALASGTGSLLDRLVP